MPVPRPTIARPTNARATAGSTSETAFRRDHDEAEERRALRAEPVGHATARDLHRHVHHELHRDEEPDGR